MTKTVVGTQMPTQLTVDEYLNDPSFALLCMWFIILAGMLSKRIVLSVVYHNLIGDRYRLRYIYGMRAPFGGDSVYARMNVWTYEPIKKGLTADFVCVYAILTELSLRETLESVVIKLKRNSIVMVLIVRSCPLCSNETGSPFLSDLKKNWSIWSLSLPRSLCQISRAPFSLVTTTLWILSL